MRSLLRWVARAAVPAVLLAALLAGCGSSSSGSAASTSTPAHTSSPSVGASELSTAQQLSVVPRTGLAATATVRFTATGFPADDTLAISECLDHGVHTGQSDCDVLGTTTSNAQGRVTGSATVTKGPVGSVGGTCGRPVPCLLSVSELSANGDSATQDLAFATKG
jgi:hypothetical protein